MSRPPKVSDQTIREIERAALSSMEDAAHDLKLKGENTEIMDEVIRMMRGELGVEDSGLPSIE